MFSPRSIARHGSRDAIPSLFPLPACRDRRRRPTRFLLDESTDCPFILGLNLRPRGNLL